MLSSLFRGNDKGRISTHHPLSALIVLSHPPTPERSPPLSRLQPVLFHPPFRHLDPVLAEKVLAVEDERRHAPMAGDLQRDLVGRDFGIEFLGVAPRLCIAVGDVEPGAAPDPRQMIDTVTVPTPPPAPPPTPHPKPASLTPPT